MESGRGRLLTLLAVFALVVTASAPVVGAADVQQANNTTGNATGGQAGGGGANGTNGTNATGGGGIGVPGIDVDIDPVGWFLDMIAGAANAFMDVPKGAFDAIRDFVFTLVAPGTLDDPQSWQNPPGDLWSSIYDYRQLTLFIAIPMLVWAGATAVGLGDPRQSKKQLVRVGVAGVMILLMGVVPPAILHTFSAAIDVFVPTGEEVFSTPGNVAKLGAGLGVGLIIALVNAGAIGVGLFVLGMERFLVIATVTLWPLAWAAWAWRIPLVRSLGQTILYIFGVVVATKFMQAILAGLLFSLPLTGGAASVLVQLAVYIGGIAFALLIFPKSMLDHANDSASFSLGASTGSQKSRELVNRSAGRVRQRVAGAYDSARTSDEAATTTERRTVGTIGSNERAQPTGSVGHARGGSAPAMGGGGRVGGATPDNGVDADDWSRERERMRRDRDRGIQ